jgi:hypothetical protein
MDASVFGRGAGEGFGVHVLTGPIFVCGAEPGDVLEVKILEMAPRPSGNPAYAGKTFGSNAAAWWGFHYNDMIEEPKPREVIIIYEIDSTGARDWAQAVYNYRWVPQTDPFGVVHEMISGTRPVARPRCLGDRTARRHAVVPVGRGPWSAHHGARRRRHAGPPDRACTTRRGIHGVLRATRRRRG